MCLAYTRTEHPSVPGSSPQSERSIEMTEDIKTIKSDIPGGLSIANDVIADIAGYAALECYGVVGMAAPNLQDGIAKILPRARLRRGINVESGEAGVRVDLFVVIEYGTSISAVSKNLVDNVTFALTDLASVTIDSVEVHVQGVKTRN